MLLCGLSGYTQTLQEAIRLNENEQHAAASGVYQLLITKEPANGTNYYYYAENLLDAEVPDSALLILEKGKQVDPNNPLITVGLAEIKLNQGNLQEGSTMVANAVTMAKDKSADVLIEAAEALIRYKVKDAQTALVYAQKAAVVAPKNPEAYNIIGDVYSEQNNGTLAANNYNKALELDKNQVKALLHKGQLYKRSTNYEGAALEFENALKIDANFAPAYRELGEVSYYQRKLEKAKEYYRKYLELSKNNPAARLRFASFLFYSENYQDALAELSQITKVDSSNLGMMRLSAYLNYENNDNAKAEQLINKVFSMTESDSSKRITLDYVYFGKILAKNGNDSLGADYINRALALDSSRVELYTELGTLYQRAKKYNEAAAVFEKRIAAGGKLTTADYFKLGQAYHQGKQFGKADTAFAKVVELQESWPDGYLWRARANHGMDPDSKQGLAKPFYETYIEKVANDSVAAQKYVKNLVEANNYLAYYYLVKKDCTQAALYCKKILEYEPDNKQAKDILEVIRTNPKAC